MSAAKASHQQRLYAQTILLSQRLHQQDRLSPAWSRAGPAAAVAR
jgi:hypothetical protein